MIKRLSERQTVGPSRRRLLLGAAALTLVGGLVNGMPRTAAAAKQAGAAGFMEDLGARAVSMLGDPAIEDSLRLDNFRQLMKEGFDLPTIARFILGRFWKNASESQRTSFIDVFQRVMAARFAPFFTGASAESFEIKGATADAETQGLFTVNSVVKLVSGKFADVKWRVVERDGSYRIVDVVTEGVSMGITLRSEYGSVIGQSGGNIDPLIEQLRAKVEQAST